MGLGRELGSAHQKVAVSGDALDLLAPLPLVSSWIAQLLDSGMALMQLCGLAWREAGNLLASLRRGPL